MEQSISHPGATIIYAGFWTRAAAYIMDLLIANSLSSIFSRILFGNYYMYEDGGSDPGPGAMLLIVNWIYFAWQESSARQATIGKLVVGVKVCTENGERLTFANATGRYFAKILSALLLLIGFIMVAFDKKKQALHDKLAKTFVIYQ
jgi:uncharacterized RDD family membrane protein YckC